MRVVIDASVHLDLFFDYNPERTQNAETLFKMLEDRDIQPVEPDLFKVEISGQIARRIGKEASLAITENIFMETRFVESSALLDIAMSIALETGSRALDALYIATAMYEGINLISNDMHQVKSARKMDVEAFYLLDDLDNIRNMLESG